MKDNIITPYLPELNITAELVHSQIQVFLIVPIVKVAATSIQAP